MAQQTATGEDLALSPQAPLINEDWLAVGTGSPCWPVLTYWAGLRHQNLGRDRQVGAPGFAGLWRV